MNVALLAAAIAPALIAWLVIRLALASRYATHASDHPNERSLHDAPRPRVGGIGVIIAALPFAAWHAGGSLQVIVACAEPGGEPFTLVTLILLIASQNLWYACRPPAWLR